MKDISAGQFQAGMLIAISGEPKAVNRDLLELAFQHRPSLIIDCGNCANPHAMFPHDESELHQVYVINSEAIYRLRDALRQAERWAKKLRLQTIVVTTLHTLFSYDDEVENKEVIEHCWELMKALSERYLIFVGSTRYEGIAVRYADKIETL